jgi:hypothetical protein
MLPLTRRLQADAEWRLPKDLVDLIYAEILAPLDEDQDPRNYHYILQDRLKALGTRLGYVARLEYPTPYIDQNRSGRVDVVWNAPAGGRSIAIEIDRGRKKVSMTKLIYMARTHQPVWIFIGPSPVPFVPEGHDLRKVHLLRVDPRLLPAFKRKRSARTSTPEYRRRERGRAQWYLRKRAERLAVIRRAARNDDPGRPYSGG